MRAALAAVLLAGCANWADLECRVRMACGDDGGEPLSVVAAFADAPDQPVIGLARGSQGFCLARPSGVCLADGSCSSPFDAGIAAIDAAGVPSRFWLASSAGAVWGIEEIDGGVFDYPASSTGFVPMTLAAYVEADGFITAAVFGGTPLQVKGFSSQALAPAGVTCEFAAPPPDSAAFDGLTATLVVGYTPSCAEVTDAGSFAGYAAAVFPRAGSNVVMPLGAEATPGRARVGSNGKLAVAVMETSDGIAAVRFHDLANDGEPVMALHLMGAGPSPRGFLDDVEQGSSDNSFVVSLSNHTATPVVVVSADSMLALPLAPGSTALVALKWTGGIALPSAHWSFGSGAPDDLHLDADPKNTDVWLAASCRADAGTSGPCANGPSWKVVLRVPDF